MIIKVINDDVPISVRHIHRGMNDNHGRKQIKEKIRKTVSLNCKFKKFKLFWVLILLNALNNALDSSHKKF
jgi:hypothetical protein